MSLRTAFAKQLMRPGVTGYKYALDIAIILSILFVVPRIPTDIIRTLDFWGVKVMFLVIVFFMVEIDPVAGVLLTALFALLLNRMNQTRIVVVRNEMKEGFSSCSARSTEAEDVKEEAFMSGKGGKAVSMEEEIANGTFAERPQDRVVVNSNTL